MTRPPPRLAKSAVALTLVFAYGLLGSILVAMPLTEVARVYYGGHPQGDAPLAEPGALALGDLILGRGQGALSAALPTSLVLAVLVAGGAHLPFGALLAHLARQDRRGSLREAYARSAARFFVLGSASLVSLAARAVVTLVAVLAAQGLAAVTHGKLDDRASDLCGLVALVPFGALLFALHVVTDLAYVGIAAYDLSLPKAFVSAVRTFRSKRRHVVGPALLAYLASLGLVAIAAKLVGFFALSASAGLVFGVHQAALAGKLYVRARWLAVAIARTTAEDPLGPPSVVPRELVAPEVRPSEPGASTVDGALNQPPSSPETSPSPIASSPETSPSPIASSPETSPSLADEDPPKTESSAGDDDAPSAKRDPSA